MFAFLCTSLCAKTSDCYPHIGLSLRKRKQQCDQWKRQTNISTWVGAEAQHWLHLSIADNYDLFSGSSALKKKAGGQRVPASVTHIALKDNWRNTEFHSDKTGKIVIPLFTYKFLKNVFPGAVCLIKWEQTWEIEGLSPYPVYFLQLR